MAPASPAPVSLGHVAKAGQRLAVLLPAEARGMANAYIVGIGEGYGSWRYSAGDRTSREWAERGGYWSDRSCRRGTTTLEALGLVDRGLRAWQMRTPALCPDRWIELGQMIARGDVPAVEAQVELAERAARADGRWTKGLARSIGQIRDRVARWALVLAGQAERVVARGRPSTVQPEPEPRRPGDSGGPIVDQGPDVPAWLAGICAEAGLRLQQRAAWATLQAAATVLQPDASDDQVAELAPGLARLLRRRQARPEQLVEEAQALTRAIALPEPPRPLRGLRARLVEGKGPASVLRSADWQADSLTAARALRGRAPSELAQLDQAYRGLLGAEPVTPAARRPRGVTAAPQPSAPAGRDSEDRAQAQIDRARQARATWAAMPEPERELLRIEARAELAAMPRSSWAMSPAQQAELVDSAAIGRLIETL